MTDRSDINEAVLDEAIAWSQALARDDADWDAYAAWLEADPVHRRAFDEIALLDRAVDEHAGALRYVDPPARSHPRWPWAAAVAAAMAVGVALPVLHRAPADIAYVSGPHAIRHVALGRGVVVELAPASRLVALGGDPARLVLASGEAYLDVSHDPQRALTVRAGDFEVRDIGTRFGVSLGPKDVTVAVAEGHVSVAAGEGAATPVAAGEQLVADRTSHDARKHNVVAADVSSWREGRLVYEGAPLAVVAADLARYSGKTVTVDPAIGDRQFSGVLVLGDGSKPFDTLAGLMAISARVHDGAVRLGPAAAR